MEIWRPKIERKCYTTTTCKQRVLLQHHHVENAPWGRQTANALPASPQCQQQVLDQKRSISGSENRMMRIRGQK